MSYPTLIQLLTTTKKMSQKYKIVISQLLLSVLFHIIFKLGDERIKTIQGHIFHSSPQNMTRYENIHARGIVYTKKPQKKTNRKKIPDNLYHLQT